MALLIVLIESHATCHARLSLLSCPPVASKLFVSQRQKHVLVAANPIESCCTCIPPQKWDAGKCAPILQKLLTDRQLDVTNKRVLIPGCG